MPKRRKTPSYRLHKARNCGVVTIDGNDDYLGPYDSPESWERYYQLLADWAGNGHTATPCPASGGGDQTINEVIACYWRFAQTWYVKDGEPTDAIYGVKAALRVLREMYGSTLVRDFGPLRLQSLLTRMVEKGWSRTYCNDNLGRIKRVFRWGKSQEIAPDTPSPADPKFPFALTKSAKADVHPRSSGRRRSTGRASGGRRYPLRLEGGTDRRVGIAHHLSPPNHDTVVIDAHPTRT